jgi:hypothetical protein
MTRWRQPGDGGNAQRPPLRQSGQAIDMTALIERSLVVGGLISEYRRAA